MLWLLVAVAIALGTESPLEVAEQISAAKEEGKLVSWKLDTSMGLFLAAIVNIEIAALLLGTMRWWCARNWGDTPREGAQQTQAGEKSQSRIFWVALLVIVVLAGAVRWNLAAQSLVG